MKTEQPGLAPAPDPIEAAQGVADAVLYEGYLLYPYRASATKNQVRWQFGVLVPPSYAAAGTGEHATMQTECLLIPQVGATLQVRLRFLHLVTPPAPDAPAPGWDEAAVREVDTILPVAELFGPGIPTPFTVPGGEGVDPGSGIEGTRCELRGELWLRAEPVPGPHGLIRLRAQVTNTSTWADLDPVRAEALRHSLVATHTLFAVARGEFVSLLDPPEWAVPAVAACQNLRTWPVLVGDPQRREVMLSAPIILYDYPAVAPESPGELFDSTEIDELLSLRTLTLTDSEKQEARATDPRAAELVDRVDNMPPEMLARLHGAIRSLEPDSGGRPWDIDPAPAPEHIDIAGQRVSRGSKVRLAPAQQGTDAQDMFLVGRSATVREVLHDVDGGRYLAVTLDDDLGADLHVAHGRFRYFAPEEVEPLGPQPGGPASQEGAPDQAIAVSGAPSSGAGASGRVLVAGVGNIFLGDDGFGVELARRLARSELPAGVEVVDYGIRGVHLAYDLLGGYDTAILLDAAPRGESPGTVTVLELSEPHGGSGDDSGVAVDAHGMQPDRVLALARMLGGDAGRVLLVACEPASTAPGIGLSEQVAAAAERAVPMVRDLAIREASGTEPEPVAVGEERSK